jgi:shikimate dehydrogenase
MKDEIKYFAVTGDPILHSRSPFIFNTLFNQYSLNYHYTRLSARSAEEAISMFRRLSLSGMNVTSPFKSEIILFLDEIDEHGKKIGAVNTIKLVGNKLVGYNTDFLGVVGAIKNHGIELKNKKCIVLGGGNAGRAAIYGLLKERANVIVVNRTYEKARKAALDFDCKTERIENLNNILIDSDILISTIPYCYEYIKTEYLSKGLVFLNANYKDNKVDRIFEQAGCIVIPGEEWLYNQAIPAFEIFTGVRIDNVTTKFKAQNKSIESKKIISLIGFMGSGKTTIGRILAEKLSLPFIDTDEIIEKREGRWIPKIFKAEGEAYFRELEKKVLSEIDTNKSSILASGGGLMLDEDNRRYLENFATNIYLHSSFETCINRAGDGTRPLLNNLNILQANKIYNDRFSSYFSLADLIVNNEDSIEDTVNIILKEIYILNNR